MGFLSTRFCNIRFLFNSIENLKGYQHCVCYYFCGYNIKMGLKGKKVFEHLPNDVIPLNYKIRLQPDLCSFTFSGTEDISVEVNITQVFSLCARYYNGFHQ